MTENEFRGEWQLARDGYREVISYRDDALFSEFLPRGYAMTSLSCVAGGHFYRTLLVKCHLGMFITLLDDFADNPELRDKALLEKLYRVAFDEEFIDLGSCTEAERKICDLALKIRGNMKAHIRQLPGFIQFYDIFKFDFEEIMRANQYSELMTDRPDIANPEECHHYGAYNMGMVLAGMIDLMSTPELLNPLGVLRHMFLLGQRYSRLCNLSATLDREKSENDTTNEFVVLAQYDGTTVEEQQRLANEEMARIINKLRRFEIQQFDTARYVLGLENLCALHFAMIGKI